MKKIILTVLLASLMGVSACVNKNIKENKINEKISKYNKPIRIEYSIKIDDSYKKEESPIKQKISSYLGKIIEFSNKKPDGLFEIRYTIIKSDSLNLTNLFNSEYKSNGYKIRIDSQYKDLRNNKIRKSYVEWNINDISSLLNDLNVEIIKKTNIIDNSTKSKKYLNNKLSK